MLCVKKPTLQPSTNNCLTVTVLFLQRGSSLKRKSSLRRGSSLKRLSFKRKESKKEAERVEEFLPENNLASFLEIQPPKNGKFSAQISLKSFGGAKKIIIKVLGSRLEVLKVCSKQASWGSLYQEQGRLKRFNKSLKKDTIQDTAMERQNIRERVYKKRFGEDVNDIQEHSTVKCPQEDHAKMNETENVTSCGYIILPTYIDPETLEFFIDGKENFNIRASIKGALPYTKPESPKPAKKQIIMSFTQSMFSCISTRSQHEYRSRVCSSPRQFLSEKLSRNLASSITVPLSSQKSKLDKNCESLLDLTFPVRHEGNVTVKGVFKPNDPTTATNKEVTQKGKFLSCTWVLGKP